jgi:hypothetical protein
MTDLGHLHYYLVIEVNQNPKYIFVSQNKYVGELLNKFGMTECNPVSTPLEPNLKLTSQEGNEFEDEITYNNLVGSLVYLTTTRTNISFVFEILSRFMQNPCEGHFSDAKRVLKYLKGTQYFGIRYSKVDDFNLIRYFDSKFVRDQVNGVSTSSHLTSLGSTTVS